MRPALSAGPHTFFSLEYEADLLAGGPGIVRASRAWKPSGQALGLRWRTFEGERATLVQYVDRLFVRQDIGPVTVTAGRQRIAWGTGRVWNPTDRFNPIDPAAYDRIEKDGVDALSAKFYAGDFTDAEAVVFAGEDFRHAGAAGRLRTSAGGFDVSAMGGRFDSLTLAGGDFAGSIWGWGVRGEAVVPVRGAPAVASFVLGIDNQFSATLYGLAEYFRNGGGGRPKDGAAVGPGEIPRPGRDHLHAGVRWLAHPLVTCEAGINENLGDGSGFVLPRVAWAAGENLEVSAGALITHGGPGSEYGPIGSTTFVSLTLWF